MVDNGFKHTLRKYIKKRSLKLYTNLSHYRLKNKIKNLGKSFCKTVIFKHNIGYMHYWNKPKKLRQKKKNDFDKRYAI